MHAHTSIFAWRSSRAHLGPKLGSMLVAALIVAPLGLCGEDLRQAMDDLSRRPAAERVESVRTAGQAAAVSREAMVSVAP